MTDSEILTLVDKLERCLLTNSEFHHRDHLTVAVAYLYAADVSAAMEKMGASLRRFAAHMNSSLYHETKTRFWMLMAQKHLDRRLCLHESVERVHNALKNKDLIYQFYSRERLESAEAKARWVEPDRRRI